MVDVMFADLPHMKPTSADGKLVLSVLASMAAYYGDKQSEKMKAVYAERAKKYGGY